MTLIVIIFTEIEWSILVLWNLSIPEVDYPAWLIDFSDMYPENSRSNDGSEVLKQNRQRRSLVPSDGLDTSHKEPYYVVTSWPP